MATTSSPPTSRAAFTLVELLVVITIIIILAGLLFPAFGAVQERAKKVQASTDEQAIVSAVKSYYTEYGHYPLPVETTGADGAAAVVKDFVFKPKAANDNGEYTNDRLINVLRGRPTDDKGEDSGSSSTTFALNPRQIVFLEAKDAKDRVNPKAGISTEAGTNGPKGQWMDPWGSPYVVFVDADYDNKIGPTIFRTIYTASTDTKAPPPQTGIAVSSFGKDLAPGTKTAGSGTSVTGDGDYSASGCDDVISWR